MARFSFAASCLVASLLASHQLAAQTLAPERTLDELRAETLARVTSLPQASMVVGILPADAKQAMANLKSTERDDWAAAWLPFADRYMEEGKALEARHDAKAPELYLRAYEYYKLAHYPTDNSPKKKEAYRKSLDAFQAYAKFLNPKLETVRIPFEGKEIVGYLRLPAKAGPVPLLFAVTALDSRKEEAAVRNAVYLEQGIGVFVTDMPGTGQAPIIPTPNAERMLSKVLDYLATRPEIDKTRIGFYGGSWSGYWAAKMAIVEKDRLRAVIAQGVPAHYYFQKEWQEKALGTREYLMDLFGARASVYQVATVQDFLAYGPQLSLMAQGLIDKPSAPTLLINGEHDTQVPIDDLLLLLRHGSPKQAWLNPDGGHMGKSKAWPTQKIARDIAVPWMVRMLNGDPVQQSVAKFAGNTGGSE